MKKIPLLMTLIMAVMLLTCAGVPARAESVPPEYVNLTLDTEVGDVYCDVYTYTYFRFVPDETALYTLEFRNYYSGWHWSLYEAENGVMTEICSSGERFAKRLESGKEYYIGVGIDDEDHSSFFITAVMERYYGLYAEAATPDNTKAVSGSAVTMRVDAENGDGSSVQYEWGRWVQVWLPSDDGESDSSEFVAIDGATDYEFVLENVRENDAVCCRVSNQNGDSKEISFFVQVLPELSEGIVTEGITCFVYEEAYLHFRPDETAEYILETPGYQGVKYITLYEGVYGDMNPICSGEAYDSFSCMLEAEKDYLFGVRIGTDIAGEEGDAWDLPFLIIYNGASSEEPVPEDAVEITPDTPVTAVNGLYCFFRPESSGDYRLYANPDPQEELWITLYGTDNSQTMFRKSRGEGSLTGYLSAEKTYYYYVEYSGTESPDLILEPLGEEAPEYAREIDQMGSWVYETGTSWFLFEPDQSGEYVFDSYDAFSEDIYIVLYQRTDSQTMLKIAEGKSWENLTRELTAGDTYYYHVVCSRENEDGWYVYARIAFNNHLSVRPAGSEAVKVRPGESAVLEAEVSCIDREGLEYMWQKNWEVIDGATGNRLELDNVTQTADYAFTVRDRYGNEAEVYFSVLVDNSLRVAAVGSEERAVPYGSSTELRVEASAYSGNISYQWYTSEEEAIDGATDFTYTAENVTAFSRYLCNVSDEYGGLLTVEFTVRVDSGLKVTTNCPGTIYADPETTATMEVAVEAAGGNYSVQWYRYEAYGDPEPINGATGTAYTTGPVMSDATYLCRVSDEYGYCIEKSFRIEADSGFTVKPSGFKRVSVQPGERVRLQVEAKADYGTVHYYWFSDLEDGISETDECLTESVNSSRGPGYHCNVSDDYGHSKSVWFILEVDTGLTVEAAGETDITVQAGEQATMQVSAFADPGGVSYQWEDDSGYISGATGPEYTTGPVSRSSVYRCGVTDQYGQYKSVKFTVTVENGFEVRPGGEFIKDIDYSDTEAYTLYTKEVPYDSSLTLEPEGVCNSGPVSYTWYESWDYASFSANQTVTLNNIREDRMLRCRVSDQYGNYEFIMYRIKVSGQENHLTAEAQGKRLRIIEKYEDVTLSVGASCDAGSLNYTWSVSGDPYSSDFATGPEITLRDVRRNACVICTVTDEYNHSEEVWFYVAVRDSIETVRTGSETGIDVTLRPTVLSFVPESTEKYTAHAYASTYHLECMLFDADGNLIGSRDYGQSECYTADIPLTEGNQYYYVVYMTTNNLGGIPFSVSASASAETLPAIKGNSLRLSGVLGLKYYLEVPEGFDGTGAVMTFSIPQREDQTIAYEDAGDEGKYKVFECGVYAYQMADEITATFTYGDGQEITDTYSVRSYLEDEEIPAGARGLADAAGIYGRDIQPYLARVNGWALGEKYARMEYSGSADAEAAAAGTQAYRYELSTMDRGYVSSAAYYPTFNDNTKLNLEIKLLEAPEDVTLTVDGVEKTPAFSGKTCRVSITDIAANQLGDMHRIILNAGGREVFNINVSVLSYVHTVLSKSSPQDDEKAAMAALYHYWQEAAAYQGAQ